MKTKPGFLKRFGAEMRIEELILCDIIAGSFLRVECQNISSQSQMWSDRQLDCVVLFLFLFMKLRLEDSPSRTQIPKLSQVPLFI